ncbi:MAG: hypothetical protein ACR2LT_07085 [Pyrinomonadaceae bacterium]
MNGIRCPQCSLVNSLSAAECKQCHFPLGNLPASAFITVPEPNIFGTQSAGFQAVNPPAGETGRKTYFWYRMYCAALVILYLILAITGAIAVIDSYGGNVENPRDAFTSGVFLLILGGILSPRPASWILGIVLIALGMTSLCLVPFTLPLLFFWLKPQTRNYFGRDK